jgi:Ca2+-binding EF-hand superfamily protein
MNSVKKDLDILFERNLKWRLLKRAFTSADGIKYLVKIFRYYDLTNTGKINKDNWITALLSNGLLIGITKEQLSGLFDKYKEENTEMIDYKKFAFDLFFHPSKIALKKSNINNYNNYYSHTEEVTNSNRYNNNAFVNINETSSVSKSQSLNNKNLNNSFPLMSPNLIGKYENYENNMRYNYLNNRITHHSNNSLGIDYNGSHVNMINNALNYFRSKININNGLNYYRLLSQLKSKCSADNKIPKNFLPIALQNVGVFYTQNELQNFFYALGCHDITINTFSFSKIIELIKDEMNEERKKIVINAFNNICTTLNKSSDSITLNDLKEVFKPETHPEVINKRRTPNDIYMQFTETLEIFAQLNNIINNITLEQFIDYYSGISSSIYNDSYFEHIINNVWSIKKINSNDSDNNVTSNNNNMVKSPSMPKIYDKLNIDNFNINYNQNEKNNSNVNENVYNNNNFSNRERNNASNTKINLPLFYYNKSNNYRNFGGLPKSTNFSENNELFQNRNNNYALTPHSKEEYQKLYGGIEQNNSQKFNDICSTPSYNKISENLLNKDLNLISTKESNNTNVDISPIINKLRQMFILQGIKSIFYFQRMLYVYDINHTGEISFTNLQNIIQAYNYNFSTEEIKTLFQFYDKENTGYIKYNYLFMEIFGNMDMMRYTLVKKLFDSFPKNENGSISIDVIKKSFCPIQHYEVVNGKRKTDEVYGEFLELIDIFREYASNLKGGVPKNDLTFEEFCDFFGEISLEIQNDYAFSNLIQNCWMIN